MGVLTYVRFRLLVSNCFISFVLLFKQCTGLPAIINFAYTKDGLMDGVSLEDAGRRIEERGAAVVGLNCARGPGTIIEPLKRLRKACKVLR